MTEPAPLAAEVEAFLAGLARTASPATLDAYRRLVAFCDRTTRPLIMVSFERGRLEPTTLKRQLAEWLA